MLTNKAGLAGNVKVEGRLDYSGHEIMEFRILGGRSRAKSKITALGFRGSYFGLFIDLFSKFPWDITLEHSW